MLTLATDMLTDRSVAPKHNKWKRNRTGSSKFKRYNLKRFPLGEDGQELT